jgi:hypothetical protein
MDQDAIGFLLHVVPVVLRININIVYVNENEEVKDKNDKGFKIIEGKSKNPNLILKGSDSLNLHDRYLHLIMINKKFEIIYKTDYVKFEI